MNAHEFQKGSYLILEDVCLNIIVRITKFINMAPTILFFLCIFVWNSNVSGNQSSCQDVYAEIETLKKLFSDEIHDLKTVVKNQDSEMKHWKTVVKNQDSEMKHNLETVVKNQDSEMKHLKTVVKNQDSEMKYQNSEIKELKKQMAMHRNKGNDSLDEKVVSK